MMPSTSTARLAACRTRLSWNGLAPERPAWSSWIMAVRRIGEVAHHLHALDLGVVPAGGELVLRVQHAVEAGLDVLGAERRAVVELDALAQLDLPGGVVEILPRHRQARPHLARLQITGSQVV